MRLCYIAVLLLILAILRYFWENIPIEIHGDVVSGVFLLITAFLAYEFGLMTYYRQRTHEQIMKRYLEEGIDRAAASIEHAVEVFTDNQRAALSAVRALKNKQSGIRIEEKDYSPVFRESEQQYLDATPFLKIGHLVGDNIFWESAQLLWAFVDGKTNWFNNDFRLTVKQIVKNEEEIELQRLLEATKDLLKGFFKESKGYLLILLKLETVATIIERESDLTWSELDEFKNRPDIIECVKTLKGEFTKDLKSFEVENEESKEPKDEQRQ
jgi:hypothetical protein